ncbi:hypothetical protein LCGC14_1007580 [marine sediment metagenome]|uniref:Uncharacterized protein n=1 Tax=marine sediment metagenome TaxID=412755 RepID=A0A0F9N1C7_9ZZZZ
MGYIEEFVSKESTRLKNDYGYKKVHWYDPDPERGLARPVGCCDNIKTMWESRLNDRDYFYRLDACAKHETAYICTAHGSRTSEI